MTQEEINVDEATVGRILHFVMAKGERVTCRPALVVEDWPNQGKPGYVNLAVFPDGSNDKVDKMVLWETSVLPNHAVRAARTWHWPRECNHMEVAATPFHRADGSLAYHNHSAGMIDIQNCIGCLEQVSKK